nr:Lipopolysaccharide assembly protein B [Paraburkholderia busanensis]
MNHDIDPAIERTLATAQQHFAAGQFDDAARLLREIVANVPDHGEAHEGLGYIAAKQGDPARAATHLLKAAEHMPMSVEQLNLAADVCRLAQRHDDARTLLERCIAREPHHVGSLHGLAMSLIQLGELEAALEHMTRLCRLQPQSAEAQYNLGTLLGTMRRHDDELDAYRRAIAINPRFVNAYVNLGVALRDLRRFDEALQQFKKALSLDPNDAGARTNRAQTNLLLGEFEHGWREYEWRWRDGTQNHGFAQNTQWTGSQPIGGKTVFVHHEQGFGDTLQFLRFVRRLDAAGARVVLRVQDALVPLLRGTPGVADVIGETAETPAFDFHIPMLSLPAALKLRADDLGVAAPYIHAAPARLPQWDELFADHTRRPAIGIVWSGSRTHLNDRQRSMSLDELAPLLDANAQFFSLQPDIRERDHARLAELDRRGVLRDVGGRLTSFADTAALIARLDLVITVDTAVAHLAGALGKPVWIALPFMPDWRWQLDRHDSPWYAQARLFRQTKQHDWSTVVGALRGAVDALKT